MAAAAAEAGIRFSVVDAETLPLIGFAGDETQAELHSNFLLPLSLSLFPLQSGVILKRVGKYTFVFFLSGANTYSEWVSLYVSRRCGQPSSWPQQSAEAIDNNSPPSSRHTDGIPVAGVSRPEVWECLFNIGVLVSASHLGTNRSPSLSSFGSLRVNNNG